MANPVIVGTALIVIVTAFGMKTIGSALMEKGEKTVQLINADKLREVMMATYLERWELVGAAEGMAIVLNEIYNAPTVGAALTEKGKTDE